MAQWDYFILRGALDPDKDRERIEVRRSLCMRMGQRKFDEGRR